MNKKLLASIILVVVAVSSIAVFSLPQPVKATAGTRTVGLGGYLNEVNNWYKQSYTFCGICTTAQGTHVMTIGYNLWTSYGGTFDMFVEVEAGKQLYIGNQYIMVNSFTTDTITITTQG